MASRISSNPAERERFDRALAEAILEKQSEVAAEFDTVHTVERARRVGSLNEIVPPEEMRAYLVRKLANS